MLTFPFFFFGDLTDKEAEDPVFIIVTLHLIVIFQICYNFGKKLLALCFLFILMLNEYVVIYKFWKKLWETQ